MEIEDAKLDSALCQISWGYLWIVQKVVEAILHENGCTQIAEPLNVCAKWTGASPAVCSNTPYSFSNCYIYIKKSLLTLK
jgi:hypothetical protein